MSLRPRQQPERAVQRDVKRLFESVGGKVWSLGTVRRKGDHPGTMQTPGLPDLWIVLPFPPYHVERTDVVRAFWFECKALGGKLSAAQKDFQDSLEFTAVGHHVGGLDDAISLLKTGGWLK